MKNVFKFGALFLALAICMSTTFISAAADTIAFIDVDRADYFYPAVKWGAEAGITQGVGDNRFAPEGEVTRAQVVTFLWRMAGQPAPAEDASFADVEAGSWYEPAVKWAVENQITLGTGENKFSPDLVCDRAMCVTLLYRQMGSSLDDIDFTTPVNWDEDELQDEELSLEDFGMQLVKEFVLQIREQGLISDVSEGSYYELPVIWACLNGVITENNTEVSEESIRFRPTDPCIRKEMISFLYQTKLIEDLKNAPMEVYFGDYILPIPQEYFDRLAIDVYGLSDDDEFLDEDEVAIVVSELASREAAEALGEEIDGQGELFRIVRVGEDRLHEMLCSDMSGVCTFARDEAGRYYQLRYPTDVRYVRETTQQMYEDQDQWTQLVGWAGKDLDKEILAYNDSLFATAFTNTMLDMYLARIAYADDAVYTISTTEFGPLEPGSVDAVPYAQYLLEGNFTSAEETEAPDGEYVVLNFPKEEVRFDFFLADHNLVREVRGEDSVFYRRSLPGSVANTEAMLSWYYTIAEKEGKKEDYKELDPFIGEWHEGIAGRCVMTISKSVGLAKVTIEARWPGSAFAVSTWEITANLAYDGKLVYSNGKHVVTEYDETGKGTVVSAFADEEGWLSLNSDGKLTWHIADGEEITLIQNK